MASTAIILRKITYATFRIAPLRTRYPELANTIAILHSSSRTTQTCRIVTTASVAIDSRRSDFPTRRRTRALYEPRVIQDLAGARFVKGLLINATWEGASAVTASRRVCLAEAGRPFAGVPPQLTDESVGDLHPLGQAG